MEAGEGIGSTTGDTHDGELGDGKGVGNGEDVDGLVKNLPHRLRRGACESRTVEGDELEALGETGVVHHESFIVTAGKAGEVESPWGLVSKL